VAAARRKRPPQPRTGPRVLGYAAQVREGWIAPGGAIVPHVARWTARAALERLALRLQLATGETAKLYEVVAERECQDRDVAQQRLAGCALTKEALHPVPNRALERATAQAKADAEKARAKAKARQERLQKAAEAGRAAAKKAAEKKAAREAKAAEKKAAREAKKKPAKGSAKKPAPTTPPRELRITRTGDAALPPGAQRVIVMPAGSGAALRAANTTELQGAHVDVQGTWLTGPLAYTNAAGKMVPAPDNAWTAAAALYGSALDARKAVVYPATAQAAHRQMVLNAQRALKPAARGKKAAAVPVWPVAVATTDRSSRGPADGTWRTLFLAPLRGGSTRWAVDLEAAAILAKPVGSMGELRIFAATALGVAIFTDAQGRVTGLVGLRRF